MESLDELDEEDKSSLQALTDAQLLDDEIGEEFVNPTTGEQEISGGSEDEVPQLGGAISYPVSFPVRKQQSVSEAESPKHRESLGGGLL